MNFGSAQDARQLSSSAAAASYASRLALRCSSTFQFLRYR